MSINHISSETLWWTKQQQQSSSPNPAFWPETATNSNMFAFNLNNNMSSSTINEDDEEQIGQAEPNLEEIPREHLFEKPLTPSDVGKLNRLVIPKQHAEKYFPLSGGNNNNNNNNEANTEKGLLLSFEDESGKSWRFRYSYWNSSQSYVLTKGWSRFVKEKRLDAGDIVLFDRHRSDADRLFIGWRRRNTASTAAAVLQDNSTVAVAPPPHMGGGSGWAQVYYGGHTYPGAGAGIPYHPDCFHAGRGAMQNQTPASMNNNTRRHVRLFGVNLECEANESLRSEPPLTPDGGGSSTSSHHHDQGQGQASQRYYQFQSKPHIAIPAASSSYNYNNNHHNHTDMNFSRDVNQMKYHQG